MKFFAEWYDAIQYTFNVLKLDHFDLLLHLQNVPSYWQSCSNFISNIVRDGEKVGIVIFNGTAYPIMELTEVTTASRASLLSGIPNTAVGYTTIGGGEGHMAWTTLSSLVLDFALFY